MWELFSLGGEPYGDLGFSMVFNMLLSGIRLKKPYFCNDRVYEIMESCWKINRHERPNFRILQNLFSEMHSNLVSKLDG